VVTLGTFDGVHRGHRQLIETANRTSKAKNLLSVAYTFDPHPATVLAPSKAPRLLLSIADRVRYLSELGIDVVIVEPFTADFAAVKADDWLQNYLVACLQPQHLVVGFNFSYGYQREGTPQTLVEAGQAESFGVEVVSAFEAEGEIVSSTRIRRLIGQGEVALAAKLLDRDFFVEGIVIQGDQRGRTLGFPTANFREALTVTPSFGVYAVRVSLNNGSRYDGVMNYGSRPTVSGGEKLFEAHIFDFDEDIYGETIRVELRNKIRDEKKFESLDALVEQITHDVLAARELLK
jgi:riboflavin kinase/FMN adenylyltransferase